MLAESPARYPDTLSRRLNGLWRVAFAFTPALIADSSSINAVNFSSPRPTKRFPLSRCASAIQVVRPRESIAATHPPLHPALLRLSAMISQYRFTPGNPHLYRCPRNQPRITPATVPTTPITLA